MMARSSKQSCPFNETYQSNLPVIVDIAIDNNGRQLYQVHESSETVREEMPRSTSFDEYDEETLMKTPIKRVLSIPRNESLESRDYSTSQSPNDNLEADIDSTSSIQENIWSSDVENAFEEVLKIIPKTGLSKLRISGRSCGRNELISDYILYKTGKFRSRKQVSSHIQVIKNLGQRSQIIKLINHGPVYKSNEEQTQGYSKFEEIFSKINLNKYMGVKKGVKRKLEIETNNNITNIKKPEIISELMIKNFEMIINDNFGHNPIYLSKQEERKIEKLKLNENYNVSGRFPGLYDFDDIPIFHNMVNLIKPNSEEMLLMGYSLDNGLKSSFKLKYGVNNKDYNIFTCVYSFGKEIIKYQQSLTTNDEYNFLEKFWKFFLNLNQPMKGLTIKQIVYDDDSKDINFVAKLKILCVLLWEFGQVDKVKDAVSTVSKLVLPGKRYQGNFSNYQYQPTQGELGDYMSHGQMYQSSNVDLTKVNTQQNFVYPEEFEFQ